MTYLQSYQSAGGGGGNDPATWTIQENHGNSGWFPILTHSEPGSKAPCLEGDAAGNIFVAYSTNQLQDLTINILSASSPNYANPQAFTIPGAGAGKYSCAFDESTHEFIWLSWSRMVRFNTLTGSITDNRNFFAGATNGQTTEYPHIVRGVDRAGELGVAWTTEATTAMGFGNSGGYPYMDIRYAWSANLGDTWSDPIGNGLTLPMAPDGSSGAPRGMSDADFAGFAAGIPQQTYQNWLDNVMLVDGFLFFLYYHQDGDAFSTRLVRRAATQNLPALYIDQIQGETLSLNSNGAFFVTQASPTGTHYLYAVGAVQSGADYRVGALLSLDDGVTWHDWAQSDPRRRQPWAFSGARVLTSDGYIIGEFTENALAGETSADVNFFNFKAYTP